MPFSPRTTFSPAVVCPAPVCLSPRPATVRVHCDRRLDPLGQGSSGRKTMIRPPRWSAGDALSPGESRGDAAATASLGYTAFRLLYEDRYLEYAEIRLGDQRFGSSAVLAALGALSAIWGEVLRSSCPAAMAWRVLEHAVSASRSAASGSGGDTDVLHGVLPAEQADAVLLHHRMGLSQGEAAELMGLHVSALAALLRIAERRVPPHLTYLLRASPEG
ncbi:sigma factor-like helix-turn-helix DNA-binding protein [Streptomyces sp. Isolate_219]|uniref:sigma-70 region 4 domain-containing protein n=1 Tax=Streptomyces sp. Isolate_219 TaxID=2950110 RepID=UPI0039673843